MGGCELAVALAMEVTDYGAARRALTEAIGRAGTGEGVHVLYELRAACALRGRQPQQALDDAMLCTKLAPNWARGWARLGEAQLLLGHARAATAACTEGLRLDPFTAGLAGLLAAGAEGAEGGGGRRRRRVHHHHA